MGRGIFGHVQPCVKLFYKSKLADDNSIAETMSICFSETAFLPLRSGVECRGQIKINYIQSAITGISQQTMLVFQSRFYDISMCDIFFTESLLASEK